jgi:hypothetical protein
MRKITIASLVVSFSVLLAITAGAQQEDQRLNDKVHELQEQWNHIMQGEYNPSAIQPKTGGHSSFDSVSSTTRHPKKTVFRRGRYHSKSR